MLLDRNRGPKLQINKRFRHLFNHVKVKRYYNVKYYIELVGK